MDLRKIIRESIDEVLEENRIVTFDGKIYPKFGWCVILAGGGGSGKGFILNHSVPINGKVINVDTFKELYVGMNHGMVNGKKYDSLNPEDVNTVHQIVKNNGYKDKYTNSLFMKDAHNSNRLPNIIFDMTAKNPNKDVIREAKLAKNMGYKVMLVWVVSNRNEALLRNLSRARRVPDSILHSTHNSLSTNMPLFLKSNLASSFLDEVWIVFGSSNSLVKSDLSDDEVKQMALPLAKTSSGFDINDNLVHKIIKFLGKNEESPNDLKTYLSSDEIASRYGSKKYDKNGNFNGYSFDRTQFNDDSNFYK